MQRVAFSTRSTTRGGRTRKDLVFCLLSVCYATIVRQPQLGEITFAPRPRLDPGVNHFSISTQQHTCPALPLHWPAYCSCSVFSVASTDTKHSWDDWVPQDRLRKLTPENRELANNLRHEMLQAQRAARAAPPPVKKKAQGSTRGSEERQTSVSAAPRGQKRMRDQDLEKVCSNFRLLPRPQPHPSGPP